ncbi:SIS domain-containing protein [Thalassotalea maritima]|uniref:SIS domain-containing protein n=1 Tax=Thalassotalea maritima TaxID=3242416 RepID=UPI0035282AA4
MSTWLTYSDEYLNENNALWTAKEICQQPEIWRQAAANVASKFSEISDWLEPIMAKDDLRIIFTGAGTSAYVGETIVPHLTQVSGRKFEAISTTDIVSNPQQYLIESNPTLLVSCARSGNSPESVAAVELANAIVGDCSHLVLTCNPNGELAAKSEDLPNVFSLIMPDGTLDQSFAMTSSFTSMVVTALTIFSPSPEQLEKVTAATQQFLDNGISDLKSHASRRIDRFVVLGSGGLQGLAREAALKMLELTAGNVLSYCESPLGFRHGPKSLVNKYTEIICLTSSDLYTSRYEHDLIKELVNDAQASNVTALNASTFAMKDSVDDVWAALPYIVYCQSYAFFKSLNANISPDNPCPTGEVNRVVQGVTIYPLQCN